MLWVCHRCGAGVGPAQGRSNRPFAAHTTRVAPTGPSQPSAPILTVLPQLAKSVWPCELYTTHSPDPSPYICLRTSPAPRGSSPHVPSLTSLTNASRVSLKVRLWTHTHQLHLGAPWLNRTVSGADSYMPCLITPDICKARLRVTRISPVRHGVPWQLPVGGA